MIFKKNEYLHLFAPKMMHKEQILLTLNLKYKTASLCYLFMILLIVNSLFNED